SSPRAATAIAPSASRTLTSPGSTVRSSPSLPLAVTTWPSTATCTPAGTGTGCLPIRDISEHRAQNLPAHACLPRPRVGQDAARRRDNGDAEAVIDLRQIGDPGIDAAAGRRHPVKLADHRLAIVIFQLDRQLGRARADVDRLETADIAFAAQHLEHV